TKADIEVDDPLVRADHARLNVDADGRWWITESAGQVFVDGARVLSAVLEEGRVFVLGQTAITASPELLAGGLVPGGPTAALPTAADALHISAEQGLSIEL